MISRRINCIGIAEYRSVAIGLAAADKMLKTGDVKLIYATVLCPGKYVVLISGNIGAVQEAIQSSEKGQEEFLINSNIIPDIDVRVLSALTGTNAIKEGKNLGVIETLDATLAIKSANIIVKRTNVELHEVRIARGMGGKSFVLISGELTDVIEGVEIGVKEMEEEGGLLASSIIPNVSPEIIL